MLAELEALIDGEVDGSRLARRLYSQDASIYQEPPLGVVRPRHKSDCSAIARFARERGIALIPRGGGTSLAGQCVGTGLVVDFSRHMDAVLEIDPERRLARVQPGVVQDELNRQAAESGLKFAPDTSTSRQALIGGMIGNNSCGAHSILHGTTREHVVEIEAIMGDGSLLRFGQLSPSELEDKLQLDSPEGRLYRGVHELIDGNREAIADAFPDPRIRRRNMGYAIDVMAGMQPWNAGGASFSLLALICGSEGTLCMVAEALVRLVPLPRARGLVCVHFDSVANACRAVVPILKQRPAAIELMDGILLEATRGKREQKANRFWIEGEPGAVLAVEFFGDGPAEIEGGKKRLSEEMERAGLAYALHSVAEEDVQRVWDLRKAALGLLTGMPGDSRPVTAIEDTAVAAEDLLEYVGEVEELMRRNGCDCVFYGHAGAGLLHLRPMLNLKLESDLLRFRKLLEETADLLRKFRGSLSGEHGDGRLRGRLLQKMLPDDVYRLLVDLKALFDPDGLMNPGKIVSAPDPLESLRTDAGAATPEIDTVFDWSLQQGLLRAVERCNGAGFCRQLAGEGDMCPSYQATREESRTTRGRANVMRQLLGGARPEEAWSDPDLAEVMSGCLSCKACATECPSSVDMARLKAEYQQKRHDAQGAGLRNRLFGFYSAAARMAAFAPGLTSFVANLPPVKRLLGIAPERRIPPFAKQTFADWFRSRSTVNPKPKLRTVMLLNDEFTNYGEPAPGRAAVAVLERLGYRVLLSERIESGRPLISKGFLRSARGKMNSAVEYLARYAEQSIPVIGIEPSALLGFRDEAPDLVDPDLRGKAERVKRAGLLFDEFLAQEIDAGRISAGQLGSLPEKIMLHGHCHQKSLAGISATVSLLRRIDGTEVLEIPSGCCGMAGSFGYEREHYRLSMQIGELILFPAIRSEPDAIICAAGISCRQQIMDGTGRRALHPAQILQEAFGDQSAPS